MQKFTAALRKEIASLARDARARREAGMFVAEGTKCVLDTVKDFDVQYLLATHSWLEQHARALPRDIEPIVVKRQDLERMSHLSTPPEVMAVYAMPQHTLSAKNFDGLLVVALDAIQDPGNLGTIIRVCDWMGVNDILCSRDTVDVFNPKVVQATMGAIARVRVHYCDLPEVFASLPASVEIFGTFLDGDNIYTSDLPAKGVIVMGNEGKGISAAVSATVTRRLFIPPFTNGRPTSESLNVAVATSIALSEFRRRKFQQ